MTMRYFNDIIIHCSATPAGKEYHASDIDQWHREQGMEEIGYHYVIALDGTIEQGRSLDKIGAHCRRHNQDSVGICYIGGLDADGNPADTRTPQQKQSLARLIWRLTLMALRNGYGMPEVHGHRDYNNKKHCPCFNARKEYN